jgi:putative ABC transport system permease protein
MTAFSTALPLAIAYLRERLMATLLNIILLGLGVGTILALLLTLSQAEQRMERDAGGIDLVVGAKGSPLQLILSAVFNVDIPTGNIPLAEAMLISAEPMVKRAIPLSLGDSFRSFRIVGTNPEYLDLYQASVAAGRLWQQPLEAVIGIDVARATASVGQQVAGSHGSATVAAITPTSRSLVGVLQPTGAVLDRLIVTGLDSIWQVHRHVGPAAGNADSAKSDEPEHDDAREITALLIQYASPMAAVAFPRRVNAVSGLQAASPAMETARLFTLVGFGVTALKLFAAILMVVLAGHFHRPDECAHDRRADLALPLRRRPRQWCYGAAAGFALGIMDILGSAGHGARSDGHDGGENHRVHLTGWTWTADESW